MRGCCGVKFPKPRCACPRGGFGPRRSPAGARTRRAPGGRSPPGSSAVPATARAAKPLGWWAGGGRFWHWLGLSFPRPPLAVEPLRSRPPEHGCLPAPSRSRWTPASPSGGGDQGRARPRRLSSWSDPRRGVPPRIGGKKRPGEIGAWKFETSSYFTFKVTDFFTHRFPFCTNKVSR